MRKLPALLVLLFVPLVPALEVSHAGLVYGAAADIQSDARGGRLSLYAPAQTGDCLVHRFTTPTPADGTLRDVQFDAAGDWVLRHTAIDGSLLGERRLPVAPAPLRITAVPRAATMTDGATDYDVRILQGNTIVPNAWVALRFQDAPIGQPMRADAEGRLVVRAADLPYAGTYTLAAYKDLDPDANGARTEYPRHIVHPPDAGCQQPGHYDVPELYGEGPERGGASTAIVRSDAGLRLDFAAGAVQVRGVEGRTVIQVRGSHGPVLAHTVRLVVDGDEAAPAQLGLEVETVPGEIRITGAWDSTANVVVEASHDANQDGRVELYGSIQIAIRDDLPIRLQVEGEPATYMVPPPQGGRPGALELRFRVLATDTGHYAGAGDAAVSVRGDVLAGAVTEQGGVWQVNATPRGGGSSILIDVAWPGVGNATIVYEVPPEGGARSAVTRPDGGLVHGTSEVRVQAKAYNWHQAQQGLCTGDACWDAASQALVELRWADTGEVLRNRLGEEARYDPRPLEAVHCQCYQTGGEYVFYDLDLERSGILVAVVRVQANDGEDLWSYADVVVRPEPVLFPSVLPSHALAGQYTTYELRASGLDTDTLQQYAVQILNETGADVTDQGRFGQRGGIVTWSAALPAGSYGFVVEERLDPEAGLWGRVGTKVPGGLAVLPPRVLFTYTEPAPGLDVPRSDTIVLGGGLGKAVQLRVEVQDHLSRPVPGTLTIDAFTAEGVAGLFAFSDQNEPPIVAAPYLFPPNELHWVNLEGRSYYLPEIDAPRTFSPRLEATYTGQSVLVYAWGTGLGEAEIRFRSASSSLNQEAAAAASLAFVPPIIQVQNITTRHGVAVEAALALGEANLVRVLVRDPSGVNSLAGYEFGLLRKTFGASQQPGATARAGPDGDSIKLAFTPDATGELSWYASNPPSLIDTRQTLPVMPSQSITYTLAPGGVLVEVPERVESGASFEVRVATAAEPFPQGVTVDVFGQNHTLLSGSRRIDAPVVEKDTDFPVQIHVPGHDTIGRILTVTARSDEIPRLELGPLPERVPEGTLVQVFVHGRGQPVQNATVELAGQAAATGSDGAATLAAPRTDADKQFRLRVQKPGWQATEAMLLVVDTARPRLVVQAPDRIDSGASIQITVTAQDETGQPIPLPSGLVLTVGARRYEPQGPVTYTAPILVQDTAIYIFAHASGHESARHLAIIGRTTT